MTTKWEIQERVARNFGDLKFSGGITSATNSGTYGVLVVNDIGLYKSEELDGGYAYIGGEDYRIAVFDPPDKKLYLVPTFATLPSAGATAYLFKDFSKRDYDVAFSAAYGRLSQRILEEVEASAAIGTLPRFDIDSSWKYLYGLEMYKEDDEYPYEPPTRIWSVRQGQVVFTKVFDSLYSQYATLYLLGQRHPETPETDTATVHENGIFQDCLGFRMIEQLGLRKMRSITQVQDGDATAVATTGGENSNVGTTADSLTSSGEATAQATLAVLEHVTGREERSNEFQEQSSAEARSGITESTEYLNSYNESFNRQRSTLTEEAWVAFVDAAVAAADALELYLYERPKVNSRRLK